VAIGQTIVAISRFWIFQDSASHNVGILKFYILTIQTVKKDELRHCAKFCQNRSNRGYFSIFQDGGRRHLGFLKFQNFNCAQLL